MDVAEDRIAIVSSDGHATAPMADYRDYIDRDMREEFEAFLVEWDAHGSYQFEHPAVVERSGEERAQEWQEKVIDRDRHSGTNDPHKRLAAMAAEGMAAEVLFPDFGVPFELMAPSLASATGRKGRTRPELRAAYRAYNRWLADFITVAPHRFAAQAVALWNDVDEVVAELTWARERGFRGVVLPMFTLERPLYSPEFEPIWDAIEDLGLVVNTHVGITSITDQPVITPNVPHPGSAGRLRTEKGFFECHAVFGHLIWGGVLERHPTLKVALTEQGTGWIINWLIENDYSWIGSFMRPDVHDCIKLRPSEYFARQCFMGSSLFSRSEVEARHVIGIDKMMIGMDYPHQESTLLVGTKKYVRLTVGMAGVPLDEARLILGTNAARVFGLDLALLEPYAIPAHELLTAPTADDPDLLVGNIGKPLV